MARSTSCRSGRTRPTLCEYKPRPTHDRPYADNHHSCGLPEGTEERLDAEDKTWRISGKYAIVSFAARA